VSDARPSLEVGGSRGNFSIFAAATCSLCRVQGYAFHSPGQVCSITNKPGQVHTALPRCGFDLGIGLFSRSKRVQPRCVQWSSGGSFTRLLQHAVGVVASEAEPAVGWHKCFLAQPSLNQQAATAAQCLQRVAHHKQCLLLCVSCTMQCPAPVGGAGATQYERCL